MWSWVSSVLQLAHNILVTYNKFEYCKGSYSLSKKHRWIKWLAQASTCGKFMTRNIVCGFSSKTLLSYFCEWLYDEGNKMGNSGCSVSGLSMIPLNHVTASLTNRITQESCRCRILVAAFVYISSLKYDLIWSSSMGTCIRITYTNNLLLHLAIVDSNNKIDPKRSEILKLHYQALIMPPPPTPKKI